ncbi:asparagine synthase-related protein [Azospirillum sp.]|uniref:asparagine synthase-related protein n=1 Tax=Azospirillum sp. TaxID=34012 RepID=UPI002D3AC16F|nr:asparagine synthase-related protein [Azospirillum sp.]HYD68964.1 asparagine synthase-related protein [Azospirillum sp.]
MSAFAGFVSFDPAGPPPGTDERLSRSLDGQGLGKPVTRRVESGVFVFRQRVLSPEDRYERQPSTGGDGKIVSMFDGRLDNRAEMLDALGLRSPPQNPIPDGDLVRAAYERWEEEAVPRLLGDFAWAVWNGRARRLMLARDHSTKRALFFSRAGGFAVFATGYRPLLALPEIARELDEVAVANLLLTSADESDRSFYKGISRVVPAGRVIVTAEGVRQDRVWEPARRPTLCLANDAEYVEAARAVFEDAVACRLRVAGPVVASVSGGLDSSAVAATAARRLAPATVHGFTVVPVAGGAVHVRGHEYADERPYVTALGQRYPNLALEFLTSDEPEAFELDPTSLFLQSGAPMRGVSNTGWFLRMLRRTGELGAATMLEGGWGNYTLTAEGFDRLSTLRQSGAWGRFARELMALRRTLPPSRWQSLARYHAARALPDGLRFWLRRQRDGDDAPVWRRRTAINPDFVRDAKLEEHYARNAVLSVDTWNTGGRLAILNYAIPRSRMQMEAGAALRGLTGITLSDPFADRRVIDFCLSLPDDQFMRDGQARSLARRMFADRLPPEIALNTHRGAQNTDWHLRLTPHRAALAAEIERLEGSALASRILDVPRLKRLLDSWPDDSGQIEGDGSQYRVMLLRALHTGQFLRWVDGGNG